MTLQEVTNLVESPTVILGSFDSGFLSLPRSEKHLTADKAAPCLGGHGHCQGLLSCSMFSSQTSVLVFSKQVCSC